MSLEYSRSALRITVAQICQNLGWNSIHAMPLELLTDVLERYLFQLSKLSHRYAEQFGLTDPRLEDVGLALGHMGVSLTELDDYIKHVDHIEFPQEVVAFPAPRSNDLKFPNPDSKEVQQRKVFEFVPEHLPYMHPELNEDTEDSNPPLPGSPERLQIDQQPQPAELSPGPGDKRPISSPGDSNLPFKRPRLTTNQLPDEASHSQYEITSVVMTNSGILSPLRQGKIPDSRTPPISKQIVIVKSTSSGAQKGPAGTAQAGVPLNPETPIIKLDFSKDPVNGQSTIVEVGNEIESGTQVNFDGMDPEYVPKKKVKDKNKLGDKSKLNKGGFKIKRGPGRPRSPGRAPVVVHKKSDVPVDIYKLLQLSRKDDSLGKLEVPSQNSPMDLSAKPTPAPPNISVKLDDSLKARSSENKQKTVISKEQEKDMEDTIAKVIEQSTRESEMQEEMESSQRQSMIFTEGSLIGKSVKKQVKDNNDVWRVSSISETFTDENAHDSFEGDSDRSGGLLSPPQPMFMAPHLQLLQQSPPKRPRGRPRGSTSSTYRGILKRGRPPGRPPLSRSPSSGRPPLKRSPGRPPLSRSPGRPPGSGRSPGRPKGSTNKHNHSPKPRGRPRGSKSPRSRGSSPRGMSPRAAIQNINFDINNLTDSSKLEREDSNDSEATMFEFPTQSPDSDPGKKVFDFDDDDVEKEKMPLRIPHNISLAPSPVPSPKNDSRESSPISKPPVAKKVTKKEVQSESPTPKKPESFELKREPSSDMSDKDVKDKMQDSEDDSRKTTNYGELDNQLRGSEERESSTEHVFKSHFQKERSSDREKRDSSREWDPADSVSDRNEKKPSEEHDFGKDKEIDKDVLVRDDREGSTDIDDKEFSPEIDLNKQVGERDIKEGSKETDIKEMSKQRESKERSKEREDVEHSIELEDKEHSKEREYQEYNRDREDKENSKEREYKELSKEREHKKLSEERGLKERSIDREHKERSKDKEAKEHDKEKEHKEHSKDKDHRERSRDKDHRERSKDKDYKERSKDREHKEHSKDREHKEHSKDREHKEHGKDKEHRRDKDHKKDKKKKKKKDKDKDRERDKDEKKDKKEKHKSKEKDIREESPSVQPLVQKLKIKFGGGTASSPGSFSISTAPTVSSPIRGSASPVHRPEIPKLKFKVLPPKPESASGTEKDRNTDPQKQSWTSSVKVEREEKSPTPKRDPKPASPAPTPDKVKPEPMETTVDITSKENEDSDDKDDNLNNSADMEVEKEVTVSVIKGKITGIGGSKKPGKRGKRKGSVKKGKPKTPKLITEAPVPAPDTKVLPLKKGLEKASSESPSHLFSMENAPSPITIPALKAAPPPPSPPASKKSPPKPKPILKEKELKPPSPLVKEVPPKPKPPPVPIVKAAKINKSPRRSSPRKSPKISPPVKKKGASLSTPTSQSPSPKPASPTKSTPFDFTVPRTPSPSPLSTPSVHSSPMYSPASSPSRDSLSFNIPPTPAFPTRTTSPPTSPPSRQISTDDEKEATPPVENVEKTKMPPPALPPMPPTSAMRRQQRSVVAETIGSFVNETGEKIWICPTCTMQDDGSPMVGCDICDDWYHWVCVGIKEEPTEDVWYCPKCKPTKTQKKRGRKKKR